MAPFVGMNGVAHPEKLSARLFVDALLPVFLVIDEGQITRGGDFAHNVHIKREVGGAFGPSGEQRWRGLQNGVFKIQEHAPGAFY